MFPKHGAKKVNEIELVAPYLKTLRRSIASLALASLSDHVTLSVSLCRL